MTSKVEAKLVKNPFDKLDVIYVGSYKAGKSTKQAIHKELVDQYEAKDIYQDILDMRLERKDIETYLSEHPLPDFLELGDNYIVSVAKVDDYAIHSIFWDNIEQTYNSEKSVKTNVESLVELAEDTTSIDELLAYAELNVSGYTEKEEAESLMYHGIAH